MSNLANIQSPQRPHNSMEKYMYIPQQIILKYCRTFYHIHLVYNRCMKP